jgi:hypothetical protein
MVTEPRASNAMNLQATPGSRLSTGRRAYRQSPPMGGFIIGVIVGIVIVILVLVQCTRAIF